MISRRDALRSAIGCTGMLATAAVDSVSCQPVEAAPAALADPIIVALANYRAGEARFNELERILFILVRSQRRRNSWRIRLA